MDNHIKGYILPFIVIAQLFCTSLWFAGNAVIGDLQFAFGFGGEATGSLTSLVQSGFIVGTLLFAFLKIADRFPPAMVFMISALLGGASNAAITLDFVTIESVFILRFSTGFFLAGIYPVGMKIASDYHEKGLGMALGYLVGALVIGTASPHLLKEWFASGPWEYVMYSTSCLAVIGGLMIGIGVPSGPYRKLSPNVDFTAFFTVFANSKLRSAAFGYFGHMWELYAFWAFIPIYLSLYNGLNNTSISQSITTFFVIAIGGLACVFGGYLTFRHGSQSVAFNALLLSLICCICSPFALLLPKLFFITFLMIWGMAVITDSPQFSTLVAKFAADESVGTALTIVNSIGFAITIGSISLLNHIDPESIYLFLWLAPGPLLGVLSFYPVHIKKNE
ncbi:MAG: MFS transporter [Bacteroidetes bacterium]|nr:MFS transporter [Bacteroidota bacterium]